MFTSSSYRPNHALKFSGGVIASIAVIMLLGAGILAQGAHAANGTNCAPFSHGLELDDGSVVASGPDCLAKFDAAGNLDPGFGDGGTSPMPPSTREFQEELMVDLFELPDGFLVVRSQSLLRFDRDGRPDQAFGGDGVVPDVEVVPFNNVIFDATADPDGGIYFSGVQGAGGRGGDTIAKLTPAGTLDPSFGEEGVYWNGAPPALNLKFDELAIDGQGRVLVAGQDLPYEYPVQAGVARLTVSGSVDSSFGDEGTAFSLPMPNAPGSMQAYVGLARISTDAAGTITLLGGISHIHIKGGEDRTFWAKFGSDGEPTAVTSGYILTSTSAQVELPGGDFVVAEGIGRRIHPDGSDAFPAAHDLNGSSLAENGFRTESVSYNPATGNLLSAGALQAGEECPYVACPTATAAVVKIDADTGEGVPGFGTNGAAMTVPNTCPGGESPPISGFGPWKRCQLVSAEVAAGAKIGHGRSRRPSLRAELEFTSVPQMPRFLAQRMTLRLPDRLKLKKAWRSRLSVDTSSSAAGSFNTSIKGRTVTIDFQPKVVPIAPYFDQYSSGEPLPDNRPVRAVVTVKRGSVRPFPRRLRGKRLALVASGRIAAGTASMTPWWGESEWSRRSVKVKVPRTRP